MASPVADLGRRKFVSQSALSELLKELKDLPQLPEATSRSTLKRARDDKVSGQTPLGPLFVDTQLPTEDGEFKCRMVHPGALLWHLCFNCSSFWTYLESLMVRKPSTEMCPWCITLYSDEVSPGNQLKPDNRRASAYSIQLRTLYGGVCIMLSCVFCLIVYCDKSFPETMSPIR